MFIRGVECLVMGKINTSDESAFLEIEGIYPLGDTTLITPKWYGDMQNAPEDFDFVNDVLDCGELRAIEAAFWDSVTPVADAVYVGTEPLEDDGHSCDEYQPIVEREGNGPADHYGG
jgi:hypothetical protein